MSLRTPICDRLGIEHPVVQAGMAGAAAVWALAQLCAQNYPESLRRAGFENGDALFDAMLDNPSGVVFTSNARAWASTRGSLST